MATQTYEHTRKAWRDIWTGTEFDRELATLDYARSRELIALYEPYLQPYRSTGTPLLEAGCGPAHIVHYYRERGYNMVGIDYAPEALIPTHERFPAMPLHMGDVHHLPYATNTFGAYLSFGVVEHFEHGPIPALKEALRVLQPRGILVLTVPHPNFIEPLLNLADRIIPSRRNRPPRAEYYETTYTHDVLAQHTRTAGFEILKVLPYAHSYTFYGVHSVFRKPGYYETSALGEAAGRIGKLLMPWYSAHETLIVGRKPEHSRPV